MEAIVTSLMKELHAHAKENKLERAILHLDGGLNSALALYTAVRAFGPKNVTALIMPDTNQDSPEDIDHARMLASHFDVRALFQPINRHMVDFTFLPWPKTEDAIDRLKDHIRAMLLRYQTTATQALWISSASKSDLELGLGYLDGRLAGDLHLFGKLYKSELIELARHVGLPDELLHKDMEMGAAWPQVDDILRQHTKNVEPETMIEKGMDPILVHRVSRLVEQQQARPTQTPILPIGNFEKTIKKAQAEEAKSI